MCIESNAFYCNPLFLFGIVTLFICLVIVFFGIRAYRKINSNNSWTEHPEVVKGPEYNKVEKQLLELGFNDFTLRSVVKYFGLNQKLPFELIGCYDDESFKIRITVKDKVMLTFDFDVEKVTFIQSESNEFVEICFDENELNETLPTGKFVDARTLLNKINWKYHSLNATSVTFYLSSKTHKRIVA